MLIQVCLCLSLFLNKIVHLAAQALYLATCIATVREYIINITFLSINLESGDCYSAPSKYSRHVFLHCNFVHVTKGMHATVFKSLNHIAWKEKQESPGEMP